MQRDKWTFDLTATDLAKAAEAKHAFHSERFAFWQAAQGKVMADVKEKGMEVSEGVSNMHSNVTRAYSGAQILIDPTYQRKLDECFEKIEEHREKVSQYAGWVQVLAANSSRTYQLNADDYLYFFGK
jgi:hypothetical protein